uniref:Uncharacterized protein n=1 Tax=Arundo donax TaxID=35708 RepID=A0A0A8XRC2_ARUDO
MVHSLLRIATKMLGKMTCLWLQNIGFAARGLLLYVKNVDSTL